MRRYFVSIILCASLSGFFVGPAAQARAGFDKGNGGDGFLCTQRTPSNLLAEEIESLLNWRIVLVPRKTDGTTETTETRLSLLEHQFPKFAAEVRADLAWVKANRTETTGVTFDDLDDDVIAWTPADCSRVQVAIQTKNRVFINGEFARQMDARSFEMLLSHESIYRALERRLIMQGLTLSYSIAVRLLNSYLWSDGASLFDLRQELAALGVRGLD